MIDITQKLKVHVTCVFSIFLMLEFLLLLFIFFTFYFFIIYIVVGKINKIEHNIKLTGSENYTSYFEPSIAVYVYKYMHVLHV